METWDWDFTSARNPEQREMEEEEARESSE